MAASTPSQDDAGVQARENDQDQQRPTLDDLGENEVVQLHNPETGATWFVGREGEHAARYHEWADYRPSIEVFDAKAEASIEFAPVCVGVVGRDVLERAREECDA